MPSTGFPVTQRISVTQTVTASSAYSAGNCVGGLMTLSPMVRRAGGSGILNSVTLRDKAGQAGTYDIFLFDATPSATTTTDKTAVAVNTADLAKIVGVITLAAVKLGAASTMGVTTLASINMSFKVNSGTDLFAILVARGTPTYASTADVTLDFFVIPD